MKLQAWREANKLTLSEAVAALGVGTRATINRIERGRSWVSPEMAELIYWATDEIGPEPVTLLSHIEAWRTAHRDDARNLRKAGRAAARKHLQALKSKDKLNGKKQG